MVPREPVPVYPRPPQFQRAVSSNSAKQSYRSLRSHSSSFEADDERSSSADNQSMGEDDGFRDGPSQYAGEDTRLTSRKELAGWYTYAFAAEVFVICGIGALKCFLCSVLKLLQISASSLSAYTSLQYTDRVGSSKSKCFKSYPRFASCMHLESPALLSSNNPVLTMYFRILHSYHPRTTCSREWLLSHRPLEAMSLELGSCTSWPGS